jgi:hypothetical protein
VVGRSGARAWRTPGGDWAALAGGLLLLRRADLLCAIEPGSGRVRWTRPLPEALPTGAAGSRGGPVLLGEAGALSALDPRSGAPRWRLELPGGHGLALSALGPLVAAGSASGLVYGVDLAGRVAWRVRAPGPTLAPPLLMGPGLVSLHAAGLAATLLFLDPVSGQRRGEVPIDVVPSGLPLRWAGGVALAGRSGGVSVVTLVRPAGRAWTVEAPLDGTPRLATAGRLLLAGDAHGALAGLEPSGRLAWSLPAGAVAGGAAPAARRGVVVAARDGLSLLELASGRPLGGVEGIQPSRLLLPGGALSVVVLEADGALTGLAATGHLSLVRGAAR